MDYTRLAPRSQILRALILVFICSIQPQIPARAAPQFALFVTNMNDSGVGSLRWAVGAIPVGGDIYFSLGGCPCTIALTTGEIQIDKSLSIVGPGQSLLSISGNNASRVFNISTANPVSISKLTIKNGEVGAGNGGGIFNSSNALYLAEVTFSNNDAAFGGGVYNDLGSTVTLMSCALSDNSANSHDILSQGAGIYNAGVASLDKNSISSNYANFEGGGIYSAGTVTISNSILSTNHSGTHGGGIYSAGAIILVNSTLSDNGGNEGGGGIYNHGGSLILTNTTISGNGAFGGGGIYSNGSITLTHATITRNNSMASAGIFNDGTANLANTILANYGNNCYGNIMNGGNNLEDGTMCGWGSSNGSLSNTSPLLGELANNGGATLTHALLPGSPAINAVIFHSPNGCPAVDQRGVPRPIGPHCDIGSYEASVTLLLPIIFK